MTESCDVLILGAGIAGAGLGFHLHARGLKVILLEKEERAGFHSTGRSAALWEPRFGPAAIRALTRASGDFYLNPPEGFSSVPLSAPRGTLMIGEPGDAALLAEARALGFAEISRQEAMRLLPRLRPEAFTSCLYDGETRDLDVDAIHQGFLRPLKPFLRLSAELLSARREQATWLAQTRAGAFSAPILVNAAGAWADVVAARAGLAPIGITPKRRSMAVVPAPADAASWPQFFSARDDFYAKPQGGSLLVSPSDADACEPHDAFADDMRLAEGIEAFNRLVDWEVTRVISNWGGLRSFARDGEPVVGFDPLTEGFFWLAGQGGYGIQTAPALSAHAASRLLGEGEENPALSPARWRS